MGRGALKIAYGVEPDVETLGKLMTRYADVPMSLADACLVRMVERHPAATVLTLDRDFYALRTEAAARLPRLHLELDFLRCAQRA